MKCKDLKVVNLNITEDNYEYKALFRLCTEEKCMDIDLSQISESKILKEIKDTFELEDEQDEIKDIIMEKVMKASKIESRTTEGKDCCKNKADEKTERDIDALSTS
ncbi:hypothetical protein RBH29_10415 [Herbivorax sp. ANBcel31]|uniref:hypothetical protein n=1 Tax=Herbivorax sp. ANBcel31 TaxID=3069754 RepID=UPI0027B0CD3F|nr:hypothetical protein [Herbivorax sp. ANBcel31]MDQ2086838.1 hypothetical protein [Herbivorax sp. ANBcel31]